MLPDRHAAPRARRVPQLDLARPVRRRAGRQPDPLPVARAGDEQREPDAQLHPQRRPDPGREAARRSCSRSSSSRASRRRSPPTVEALRQGRSMLDFVGEQTARLNRSLSGGRPAAAGPVLHLRPRAGAAAAQRRRTGSRSPSRSSPPSRRRTSRSDASSSPRRG